MNVLEPEVLRGWGEGIGCDSNMSAAAISKKRHDRYPISVDSRGDHTQSAAFPQHALRLARGGEVLFCPNKCLFFTFHLVPYREL